MEDSALLQFSIECTNVNRQILKNMVFFLQQNSFKDFSPDNCPKKKHSMEHFKGICMSTQWTVSIHLLYFLLSPDSSFLWVKTKAAHSLFHLAILFVYLTNWKA